MPAVRTTGRNPAAHLVCPEQFVDELAGVVEFAQRFEDGMILDDYIGLVGMPTGGAVRVSLGIATSFADVYRFVEFAGEFADLADVPSDLPPRLAC